MKHMKTFEGYSDNNFGDLEGINEGVKDYLTKIFTNNVDQIKKLVSKINKEGLTPEKVFKGNEKISTVTNNLMAKGKSATISPEKATELKDWTAEVNESIGGDVLNFFKGVIPFLFTGASIATIVGLGVTVLQGEFLGYGVIPWLVAFIISAVIATTNINKEEKSHTDPRKKAAMAKRPMNKKPRR
jgi:hypothetical protein